MDFNRFQQLVLRTRSIRRYKSGSPISTDILYQLIDLACCTPSARNLQPLKYILVNHDSARDKVFTTLGWAKNLENWSGPADDERPQAYILLLGDTTISSEFDFDAGIALQTMMLGARTLGLGGCILGSVERDQLRDAFSIPDRYKIVLVLALGTPGEDVRLENLIDRTNIAYWRDEDGVHHVPKRDREGVILKVYEE